MRTQTKSLRRSRRTRFAVPAAVAAAALLALTACSPSGHSSAAAGGTGGQATDVPTLPVSEAAAQLLPETIKSTKVLRVAIPTNEPPTQYYREGTKEMTGVNPDVARLIGQAVGVNVDIQVANFDSIIPGMAAGRYDLTVSSMTPTTKRMEVLDFVDYMQIGNSIAVPEGNPLGISDQQALCGKKVGLLTGSYQLTVNIPEYADKCAEAGKQSIQVGAYKDTQQAISALSSGREDAVLADSPILQFAAKHNPRVEIASTYDLLPVAVGISKDTGLVKATAAALDVVIKSDAYHAVLKSYGLESAAITGARVNFAQ
jgi:polar amino acid transport system substrate-binding protein